MSKPFDVVGRLVPIEERAARYAEQFGAERSYVDHRTMLDDEKLLRVEEQTENSSTSATRRPPPPPSRRRRNSPSATSSARSTASTSVATPAPSRSAPLERVEVIGDGANVVVVDNGVELTYYRPYDRGPYGRTTTWMGDIEEAPIRWEPAFSLGNLYTKNLVRLGYYGELEDFVECCIDGRTPDKAGLELSLELLILSDVRP